MTETPDNLRIVTSREAKEHHLRTWPEFFRSIRLDEKPFEVRLNDRDYQVGDTLVLREYDPVRDEYSGEIECRIVTYVMKGGAFGLDPDYVVMGVARPSPAPDFGLPDAWDQHAVILYANGRSDTAAIYETCAEELRQALEGAERGESCLAPDEDELYQAMNDLRPG